MQEDKIKKSGMSGKALPAGATSRVVDASKRDLSKVSQISSISGGRLNVAAINLDGNTLSTLHGIKQFPALIQLSVNDNSLVRMEEVSALHNLVSLNLQNNSLSEISGLEKLVHLEFLCLAGNSVKNMDGLATNVKISYLDLSDNCIGTIGNVSMLTQLKSLLLHGNAIVSLDNVGINLPQSLGTLSLAENEIADLNEVSHLSLLPSLCQLSLMSNPCVSLTDSALFDYRPFVCYWCPGLKTLDGFPITDNERSSSSTLFPSNKPCPFTVGQHRELTQYLYSASPLHTAQLMTSTRNDSTGNGNTPSTITDLEDVIKSFEKQSSDPKQADIIEKLKALQLVEQMIKSQEHFLIAQQNNSNQPSTTESPITLGDEPKVISPRPARNAWAETSPRKSKSPTPARPEQPLVHSTDQNTVSSTSAMPKPVEDRKTAQLKLLNTKIAQRHSKVTQKSAASSSGVETTSKAKKAASQLSARKVKPKSAPVKVLSKPTSSQKSKLSSKPAASTSAPKQKAKTSLPKERTLTQISETKTARLKERTLTQHSEAKASLPNEKTHTDYQVPGVSMHKEPTVTHLPMHPTPSKHEPSFRGAPEVSTTSIEDSDMLSSTSIYVPLSEDTLGEASLDSQFEAALEQESKLLASFQQESKLDSTLMATSLTQAYGLSSTDESAQVLSTLWKQSTGKEPGEKERVEHSGPSGSGMGPELNGNGLEECVAQNTIQLQGCRQELAHQSQLLQLQEEILQTLLVEVESLRQWKNETESRERSRAAIVIQKHWKGYQARKSYPGRSVHLSMNSALWAVCISLKKQIGELTSALSALTDKTGAGKKVRFGPADDHPPPTELKMSHYSISCILLQWAPAVAPNRPDLTLLKCYRVYVNGEVEGMVGPEKCKAYIEGLDRCKTYRITVRAVYNSGESVDSNPVVASLNPSKPTTPRSPTDQSSNHSSDEETGGPSKGHPSPAFNGESSGTQKSTQNQGESVHHPSQETQNERGGRTQEQNEDIETLGSKADTELNGGSSHLQEPPLTEGNSFSQELNEEGQPPRNEVSVQDPLAQNGDSSHSGEPYKDIPEQSPTYTYVNQEPPINSRDNTPTADGIEGSSSHVTMPNTDHTQKNQQDAPLVDKPESLPTHVPFRPPTFHFQKAKHITIDTVSVLSGCTIEYSPPLPVASTSADTLLGESSLEYDGGSTESSDSETTTTVDNSDGVLGGESNELMKTVAETKEPSSNLNNGQFVSTIKNEATEPPSTQPSTTPIATLSQPAHACCSGVYDLQATEMSAPTSKHLLGMYPTVSHGIAQGQLLTLSEQRPLTEVHTDNLPIQNGNKVLASVSDISVEFDADIPFSHASLIEPKTNLGPLEVSNVTSQVTPEITSSEQSKAPTEQPEVSIKHNYPESSNVTEALGEYAGSTNNKLGSDNIIPPAVSKDHSQETSHEEIPLKTQNSSHSVSTAEHMVSDATPNDLVLSNPPLQVSEQETTTDLASHLLLELEKDLAKSA